MFALAISPLATRQASAVVPELWDSNGKVKLVTGLHKLLSQAVFLVLTEAGSIAGMPGYGLSLRSKLSQISLAEITVLQSIISGVASDLSDQLKSLQYGLPPAERLDTLTLDAVQVVDVDLLVVSISIISLAGEQADYSFNLFTTNING